MLIEFRVENHRSIRDEQVLSMEAGRVGDDADPRPRTVKGHAEKLLPVAALYGANASGKSNVLSALAFMRDAVLESHQTWAPDEEVPRVPFGWGPKKSDPSVFEAAMVVDGRRYEYGFVATDDAFTEEWLYSWPRGKKQVWFERDNDSYKFGEQLRGENKLIAGFTRRNALFLSVASQHNHRQLAHVFSWFRGIDPINVSFESESKKAPPYITRSVIRRLKSYQLAVKSQQMLSEVESSNLVAKTLLILLKGADLGVVDLRGIQQPMSRSDASEELGDLPRIELKHCVDFDDSWLPLDEESDGTQRMFELAYPILLAIGNSRIVVLDELEASLHPSLARMILEVFNSSVTNPHNAQLIFTTHDTNLLGNTLGEPVLRRDQVWFTEKDKEGATVLYPLTDYQPRKAENLERGYLQGRYGAIPFLGNFNLVGE